MLLKKILAFVFTVPWLIVNDAGDKVVRRSIIRVSFPFVLSWLLSNENG